MAHLSLRTGTFAEADALLGSRDSRRIGHNTRLVRLDSDTLAVVFHSTRVYTMTRDGWAIMRTGGWTTVTTAARLNALLPGTWRVSFSRDGGLCHGGHLVMGFADGLAVNVETGEIGTTVDRWSNDVRVMASAEYVAQAEADSQAARDRRDAARYARLASQHPVARHLYRGLGNQRCDAVGCGQTLTAPVHFPGRYVDIGNRADFRPNGPHPRGYMGHSWQCRNCTAESQYARTIRAEALAEQHDGLSWTAYTGDGYHLATFTAPAHSTLPGYHRLTECPRCVTGYR